MCDDTEFDLTYDGDATFPDGTPKYIEHYKIIDDIMHVLVNGGYVPLFTDHRLGVERWNKYCYHEYPVLSPWPGVPMTKEHWSDWESTAQEALESVERTQRDLAANGEYVPIYIS